MKIENFNNESDDRLRQIRHNLIINNIEELPQCVGKYITTDNPQIGDEYTRTIRCIHLIDKEIVRRFIDKDCNIKMKLYHFNPNDYGEEFLVLAENKISAHEYLLDNLKNKVNDPINTCYKEMYIDNLEMWKKVNPLNPNTFPLKYTLDIHNVGSIIRSEIA